MSDDPLTQLLVLGSVGLCIVVPFAVPAVLILFGLSRRGRETMSAWQASFAPNGWRYDAAHHTISRSLEGVLVEAFLTPPQTRYGPWTTSVRAHYRAPLGIGLVVATLPPDAAAFHLVQSPGIRIGIPEVDTRYLIRARLPDRAIELLRRRAIAEALREALSWSGRVRLGDFDARMIVEAKLTDPAHLEHLAAGAVRLARAVSQELTTTASASSTR